jgi:hypothetical protein
MYSGHLPYRWQTEQLLQGRIAMSSDPSAIGWDMVWANGKVQQVWGLGVPFCRLPFELMARAAGQPAFPDRLVFLFLLSGVVVVLTKFYFGLANRSGPAATPLVWSGLLFTVLFPPFLALCSSRFLVYEESVAYGYLVCLLLMAWTMWVWHDPQPWSFIGLALISSSLPFFRPTFVFFGLASVALCSLRFLKLRRGFRLICLGGGLFILGIALLLWTNAVRFGAASEFGHSLNLNTMSSMRYASRFDHPFANEPLISSAKELIALLFLSRSSNSQAGYENEIPGLSSTFRWRELYFGTYDLSIFLMVAVSWGWMAWRLCSYFKHNGDLDKLTVLEIAAGWSILGTLPLVALYLRFPFISSRYLLDLGPGFGAACWVFVLLMFRWVNRFQKGRTYMVWGLGALVGVWWGYEFETRKPERPQSKSLTWKQVAERIKTEAEKPPSKSIPLSYTNGFPFSDLGIPFNGSGWDEETGIAGPAIALFVNDPEYVTLEVAPRTSTIASDDYNAIRAKIGLEFLERESITPVTGGMRIAFRGPQRQLYQKGMQVLFLAMVPPQNLSLEDSKFRLLRVTFHDEHTSSR